MKGFKIFLVWLTFYMLLLVVALPAVEKFKHLVGFTGTEADPTTTSLVGAFAALMLIGACAATLVVYRGFFKNNNDT